MHIPLTHLSLSSHLSYTYLSFRFAEAHHLVELLEAARDYIFANFSEVVMEDEFLEIPRDVLVRILQSEYLRIDSEFQVSRHCLG